MFVSGKKISSLNFYLVVGNFGLLQLDYGLKSFHDKSYIPPWQLLYIYTWFYELIVMLLAEVSSYRYLEWHIYVYTSRIGNERCEEGETPLHDNATVKYVQLGFMFIILRNVKHINCTT